MHFRVQADGFLLLSQRMLHARSHFRISASDFFLA
jgi:hypothetical protein